MFFPSWEQVRSRRPFFRRTGMDESRTENLRRNPTLPNRRRSRRAIGEDAVTGASCRSRAYWLNTGSHDRVPRSLACDTPMPPREAACPSCRSVGRANEWGHGQDEPAGRSSRGGIQLSQFFGYPRRSRNGKDPFHAQRTMPDVRIPNTPKRRPLRLAGQAQPVKLTSPLHRQAQREIFCRPVFRPLIRDSLIARLLAKSSYLPPVTDPELADIEGLTTLTTLYLSLMPHPASTVP